MTGRTMPSEIKQYYHRRFLPVHAFLSELNRRNEVLSTAGWFHLGLLILTLGASLFDSRIVMGVNTWIKPMKFMLSIVIYVWTVAWITGYLSGSRLAIQIISWGTAITLMIESVCIIGQAARGIPSHFNTTTSFDGVVFSIMGLMIILNMLLAVLLLVLVCTQRIRHERVYIWGIRLGILVFLVGNAIGIYMIMHSAHTVGLPDGGPGLPFVNWSIEAGDLRIAHLLGLHALQIFPLAGYAIVRYRRYAPFIRQMAFFSLFMIVYTGVMVFTLLQALNGEPLVGM